MSDQPIYYDVPFSQNKNIPVATHTTPGVETTTWHDQVPSHPPVPPTIVDMEAKLADYIARADSLLEKWLQDQTGDITCEEIDTATERVVLCQNALYYLRDLEHGNDCTCLPTDVSICRFCYLSKQYTQFMEKEGLDNGGSNEFNCNKRRFDLYANHVNWRGGREI